MQNPVVQKHYSFRPNRRALLGSGSIVTKAHLQCLQSRDPDTPMLAGLQGGQPPPAVDDGASSGIAKVGSRIPQRNPEKERTV